MGRKGGYTNPTSSLNEDYLAWCVARFTACKKWDETITLINTNKGYSYYREQNLQEQLVKKDTYLTVGPRMFSMNGLLPCVLATAFSF